MSLSKQRLAAVPRAVWRAVGLGRHASWSTRLEYVRVALLACVTEVAVRRVPLARLAPLYGVTLGGASPLEPAVSEAAGDLPAWAQRRLRVVVRVMRRWPVEGECLRHALVAGQRVRALHPELRLGVAREQATGIVAHAWLVIAGSSLDPTSGRYAELHVHRRPAAEAPG